jgi:hypothetical protein
MHVRHCVELRAVAFSDAVLAADFQARGAERLN